MDKPASQSKNRSRKLVVGAIVLMVALFGYALWGPKTAIKTVEGGLYLLADVERVIHQPLVTTEDVPGGHGGQLLELDLRLVSRPYAGERLTLHHNAYPANELQGIVYQQGDRVILYATLDEADGYHDPYVVDLYRQNSLLVLCFVFALFLLLVGGKHGLGALCGLVITGTLVWLWLLPFILAGGNPLLGTAGICGVVTLVSIPLIAGFNRKTLSAIIGVVIGVTLAGVLAWLTGNAARIIGIEYDTASMLAVLPQAALLDMRGIFMAGILIGCLGAMMDTGLSVASAVYEMRGLHPQMGWRQLWAAGMNVGRDILSMMSSTLILAYAGTAVPLMLILAAYQVPLLVVFNSDLIAAEVIRSVAGTVGLCLAVPATILVVLVLCPKTQHPTVTGGAGAEELGPAATAQQAFREEGAASAVEPHHTQQWWDKLDD